MNQTRISMRPVTLRRVVEICILALNNKIIDDKFVMNKLGTSNARARELLFEIERMRLIDKSEKGFAANNYTRALIEAFEEGDMQAFHRYFLQNYVFYRQFIELLRAHINDDKGLSIDETIKEAKIRKLRLNRTAIEVLQNWCERLGVLQRHLYEKRFYLLKREEPNFKRFKNAIVSSYQTLNMTAGLGLKLIYVEIPKLREEVCEILKMARELFDSLFKRLYYESIGKIELSGAPTITVAKRSPLAIRVIKASKKEDILAPHLDLTRERKGIEIGGKSYYYVAIHEA